MKTSPLTAVTCAVVPATTGASPGGRMSQASPTLSPSASFWSAFASSGQLSEASGTPSWSVSFGAGTHDRRYRGGAAQVTLSCVERRIAPSEAMNVASITSVPASRSV